MGLVKIIGSVDRLNDDLCSEAQQMSTHLMLLGNFTNFSMYQLWFQTSLSSLCWTLVKIMTAFTRIRPSQHIGIINRSQFIQLSANIDAQLIMKLLKKMLFVCLQISSMMQKRQRILAGNL